MRRQLQCELHRSPIAEHGWFVTVTDAHGGETTGWIGRRNRVGFLGKRPVPRELRRALRHVVHELDAEQKTHRFIWR